MKEKNLTGWLSPEGEFIFCEYGKHHEMADVIVYEKKMFADKLQAIQLDRHPLLQFNDVFLRRSKCYISLGVQAGASKNSFLDLPIDHVNNVVRISDAQIKWLREKYDELTAKQQEILIAWLEGFEMSRS